MKIKRPILTWIRVCLTALCLLRSVTAFSSITVQRHESTRFPNQRRLDAPSSRGRSLQASQSSILNLFSKSPPPPPQPLSPAATLNAQIRDLASHSTLAGTVRAIFSKLRLTPHKTKLILGGISHAVHWEELLFFYFMGWLFVPALAIPSNFLRNRLFPTRLRTFKKSYTKLIADQIAQASRIGFVVYIVDILKIILQAMGFKMRLLEDSPHFVARSLVSFINYLSTDAGGFCSHISLELTDLNCFSSAPHLSLHGGLLTGLLI